MKTLLYMFLIIPYVVFSQNFEKIKKSDTIYIFFKKDNGKQFHNLETPISNKKYDNYYYVFGYIGTYQNSMTFTHHYSISPEERKEKKSFLRKNNELIVTYYF